MSADTRKMPEPIMLPVTSITASKRVRARLKWPGAASAAEVVESGRGWAIEKIFSPKKGPAAV
jgi:hypothetical protein